MKRIGLALLALALGVAPRAFPAESVVITEFVAANVNTLRDEDGDSPDWIEIHNSGITSVNLAGWSLTDDPLNVRKWIFPEASLPPNGFLIVFASGKDRAISGAPLHTSFNLSAGGEYLALVKADGITIASEFAPAYPDQFEDISYGLAQSVTVTRLVTEQQPVKMFVPADGSLGLTWTQPSFDDASWRAGTNGVGFETFLPGFAVRNFKANLQVTSVTVAETVITNTARQSAVYAETREVINYLNTGGSAHYLGDNPFPGLAFSDVEDFVIEAKATITIPSAGNWTFGVNSDDGFSLAIGSFSRSVPGQRGPADTLATFNFPAAGDYPLRLVYFERAGGAELELFAAQGSFSTWNANNFRLVGDVANGGLAVRSLPVTGAGGSSYRGLIATDVESAMLNVSASAYLRLPFVVPNPAELQTLTLRLKYDDGFEAYLNGVAVARRNAPISPQWNSAATALRPNALAVVYEQFDLTAALGALRPGANVLAIHGLNAATNDNDFLVLAELMEFRSVNLTNQYFGVATPGTYNATNSYAKVADTKFSHDRGFYETNFAVTIACATPGATIRYTLNGSAPALTNGFTFTEPIPITNTTTLRAAAFREGFTPSDADTHSYVFIADVLQQSSNGRAPPGWPTTWGANVVDYGMDPEVVTNALYSGTLSNDLRSIPSFSIVMNLNDLFNASRGIYANPGQDGIAWERPGSVELIYPDGREGFQINCGIRLRGGFSRSTDNPKHAFRLFFRQEYGNAKLNWPVFGPDAAQTFDKFDLRCAQNYSWSFSPGSGNGVFIRDQFSRDAQLAMGQVSTHGDFYHLYLNGQYWGLYNTQERSEASFAESYFGGKEEDYDVVKVEAGPYEINATDGDLAAWTRFWRAATNGFASNEAYQRVQGNNPDGTRNPAYENLIDVPNLIDYMLVIYYGGNLDAPISAFLGNTGPNNWYGIRSRQNTGGFRFFAHDSEHTLLNVNEDRTDGPGNAPFPAGTPTGGGVPKSSPQYIFNQLRASPEFRLLAADHIHRHFFNGGVLTPEACRERFLARKTEIDRAVVAESARWGDSKRTDPFTRNAEWISSVNDILLNYLPRRSGIVFDQLRADGLYPNTAAPIFSQFGGLVPPGSTLAVTNPNPSGVVYYTLDGTDPRQLGGAVAANAIGYDTPLPVNGVTFIRARVKNGNEWSALAEATFYVQQDFTKLVLTELMYNPPGSGAASDNLEFLEFKNTGLAPIELSGLLFTNGITFSFANGTVLGPGQFFVLARNAAQLRAKYPGLTVHGQFASGGLNNGGESLALAHTRGGLIWSFSYSDRAPWPVSADGLGFSLVPVNPNAPPTPDRPSYWRASSRLGGSPGADDPPPDVPPILINEVLANTEPPLQDAIELFNPTGQPAHVGGWYLTDDPGEPRKYRIPDSTVISPKGHLVFTEAHFNAVPDTTNSFAFGARGDDVYLFSADPVTGNLTGYSHGFEFGASAVRTSFGRHVTSVGEEHFVAQRVATFGADNAGPKVGPVVISEIMYHPGPGYDEFVELKNVTDRPVPLYDPVHPTNRWRINGLGYDFPADVVIPPHGLLVVASAASGVFRTKYGVPAGVEVLGAYNGVLQDSGERLELQRSGAPDTNGVPYLDVDVVRYNDKAPWPPTADGGGPSLQRINPTAYANDPINWFVSGITPGRENVTNRAPEVRLIGPSGGAAFAAPTNILLEATANDTDGTVLKVEFFANGVRLGEATARPYLFEWRNVGPGTHTLTALATDDGFAFSNSSPVMVNVTPPPVGTGMGLLAEYFNNGGPGYPAANFTGTKVTLTNATVDFGWGGGQPIPEIAADSFSVRWTGRVQPRYSGEYSFFTISDDGVKLWVNGQSIIDNWTDHGDTENVGFIALDAGKFYNIRMEMYENGGGATARLLWSAAFVPKEVIPQTQLYPESGPYFTRDPVSASRLVGSNVTLFATAAGTAPLSYQWLRDGVAVPGATATNLVLTNLKTNDTGVYALMASNVIGVTTSKVAILFVGFPPSVKSQPVYLEVLQGDAVTLTQTAEGGVPMGFRWLRDAVLLTNMVPGGLTSVLLLPSVSNRDAGTYTVRLTNLVSGTSGLVVTNAFLRVLVDSDGDRMPDQWETNHMLLPGVKDAALDADGDGLSNLQEYQAGTDPQDRLSFLRIDTDGLAMGGGIILRFSAVSNKTYSVLFRDRLQTGDWESLLEVGPALTNRLMVITNWPAGVTQRYFRLVSPKRP